MLALAVTVFPFNTHLAFYSTFWGGLTLLLVALFAGSLLARWEAPPAEVPAAKCPVAAPSRKGGRRTATPRPASARIASGSTGTAGATSEPRPRCRPATRQ